MVLYILKPQIVFKGVDIKYKYETKCGGLHLKVQSGIIIQNI
jgi:hypothetical protein